MASDSANTEIVASSASTLLREAWFREPSLDEDGVVLFHTICAIDLISSGEEDDSGNEVDQEIELAESKTWHEALGLLICLKVILMF